MTLPVFETKRLVLRPIEENDAPGLHGSYGDAEAMRFWDTPPSVGVAETASRIRQTLAVEQRWHGMWAILTRSGGFAGMINYHNVDPRNRRLALGWILAPAFWRRLRRSIRARSTPRISNRASKQCGPRVTLG